MYIPGYNNGKPSFIKVDDILYISAERNDIRFHTHDYVYRPLASLQDYTELLSSRGFEMLNKNHLVQVNKILRYDRDKQVALFDDESPSRGVHISRRNRFKIDRM
ncbi:LytTR family transcriptional regulator DNA-binding domain-containing protein [Cohnella sp. GCM10012308]|uniref:LytTR family transcriptional regulator DNA-binding domain-containing protein n=1 Tax=Cohnella sp. GCM10012308 TaxID=3317329 RepID=UPI00360E49C9